MQSKEKTSGWLLPLLFLFFCSCSDNDKDAAVEKRRNDSLARVSARQRTDSLKRSNPLLILPPDSTYTGTYIDKYDNGITKFRGFFRFGERHGQWMSFYPNGIAWSELHYDKGRREGPNITYYPNGKLRYSGVYRNDMRDSIWNYYDSTGTLAERVLFRQDRIVKKLGPGKLP